MKIAYVYDLLYPWSVGGVEQRVFNLARNLSRRHEVTLVGITPVPGVENDYQLNLSMQEEVLQKYNMNYVFVSMQARDSLYHRNRRHLREVLMYSTKLFKKLPECEFDIIDCQNFPYFTAFPSKFYSLVRKSRLVLTWHEFFDDYWFKYMGRGGWIGKGVELALTRFTRHHVCVSPLTARRVSRYVSKDNIVIIPNGIDRVASLTVNRLEKEHDLIFVGRLVPHKNVHVIIKLLPRLLHWNPELSFLIVGEGPERYRLRRLCKKLAVHAHVKFMNFSAKKRVLNLIKRSKVLVLPSEREGFGIAAFEANACQVPVFTLKFPWNAVAFYIRQGVLHGKVANPHDEVDMCGKIKQLLQEKVHETNFDANRYDWDVISRTMESYYARVLEKTV